MAPKERLITPRIGQPKPLLLVDIDGVVSLFGARAAASPQPSQPGRGGDGAPGGAIEGRFHTIEGIPHFLSATAASHLLSLSRSFDLVWASGWEEKADEYLPQLLGLPRALPFISFSRRPSLAAPRTLAHWKLEAISAYADERPLAWVDDAFNPACHEWAAARGVPTLLVSTAPERGLTAREANTLLEWAGGLGKSQ